MDKITIDPRLNMWTWKLGSLIPKSEWKGVTYVFATHGDPDHYWQSDRLAEFSNTPFVCGKEMVKKVESEILLLDPHGCGIQYSTRIVFKVYVEYVSSYNAFISKKD